MSIQGGAGGGGLLLGAAAGGLLGNSVGSTLLGAAAGYAIDKSVIHKQPLFERRPLFEGGADERGCVRQHTKKYTERDSPPYPANNCAGQTRIGNDGELWHSKRASNGVHRWVRVGAAKRAAKRKSAARKSAAKRSAKKSAQKKKSVTKRR